MKVKKLLAIFVVLFTIILLTQSALAVDLTDSLVSYWKFDETNGTTAFNEINSSLNGILQSGASFNPNGKINYGIYQTDKGINIPAGLNNDEFTLTGWFNTTNVDELNNLWFQKKETGNADIDWNFHAYITTSRQIRFIGLGVDFDKSTAINVVNLNQYHFIVITYKANDRLIIYVDGVVKLNESIGNMNNYNYPTSIGWNFHVDIHKFKGTYDELGVWHRVLTQTEIKKLYNSGHGLQFPFLSSFVVTAKDIFSNADIDVFNATINGTFYETTNGTINTDIKFDFVTEIDILNVCAEDYFCRNYTDYVLSSSLNAQLVKSFYFNETFNVIDIFSGEVVDGFNISLSNIDYIEETADLFVTAPNYFNKTIERGGFADDLDIELIQAIINLSVFNLFDEPKSDWTILKGSKVLLNTTNSSVIAYLSAGEYNNLTIISNDNSFSTQPLTSFNVSALDNKTINFTIADFLLKVFIKDFLTNDSINNFSLLLKDTINDLTFNLSTTTGEIQRSVMESLYNLTVDAEGYSLHDNNVMLNISGDTNHTFYLYTDNSVQLYIRDEETGVLLTQLVNITFTGEQVYTTTTSNGIKYVDNLVPGTYLIKLESSDLVTKFYAITIGSRSHQELNTYMTSTESFVTFNFVDAGTDNPLIDVLVSMSRWVNNSWVVVESKTSDIIGQTIFSYVPNTAYKFVAQKNGYEDKLFNLNPILESAYQVRMNRFEPGAIIIRDVGISYSGLPFVEGNNSFSFSFNSPLGNLVSYTLTITYPGGTKTFSGVNALGETFNTNFTINDLDFFDKVKIEYSYIVSDSSVINKVLFFEIQTSSTRPYTFARLKGEHYGMGIIERTLLVVVIVMLVGGLTFMFADAGASIVISLLIYGFFVVLGFIPLWIVIITFLVGFVVLAKLVGDRQ